MFGTSPSVSSEHSIESVHQLADLRAGSDGELGGDKAGRQRPVGARGKEPDEVRMARRPGPARHKMRAAPCGTALSRTTFATGSRSLVF